MRSTPGYFPVALAAALLALGVLFSRGIDDGLSQPDPPAAQSSTLEPPAFRIEYRAGFLELTGTVGSVDHEAALRQLIEDQFDVAGTRAELEPGVIVPEAWETASLRLLYAIAATESGIAAMQNDEVMIRGVTSEPDAFESRLRFLRESLADNVELDDDIIVVEKTVSLNELCRRSLTSALGNPVEFRQSSAELRTSSYAILDKIIDVANDCRDSRIAITGHTDASGDETWNQRLSVARAQAVADYIIRGGIDPARLIVGGSGSAVPVADNASASGRSRNRRIEFELR